MRKVLVVGLVLGLTLTIVSAAHADTLSDIFAFFGFDPTQGDPTGVHPDSGGGDGSGTIARN